ncbi:hypothetical protein BJ166DRAFT_493365 [Pestalotiopsis sp. NC0098]|nr:hypothetical protein BJ166DRAFT_493365 [Pestalotiopsis sp. NC0098]
MLAAIRFVFLTNTFSLLVAAQGPLIPVADCDNAAIISAASILSSYSPALAYCSKAVPQPVSLVTRTRTSLVADDATVTETTTVGRAADTVTVTVDVATETTLAIQPPETETHSVRLTTTVISTALQVNRRAFPTDIPFADGGHGGHGGHHGHGGQAPHGGSPHHGGSFPVHGGGGGGYGGHQGYQVQPIPDTEAAAELAYLQASSADLLTSVCSCIEDPVTSTVTTTDVQLYTHIATVTISNDPRETATITKLETLTRHDVSFL